MAFCKNCGAELLEDAATCPSCGSRLEETTSEQMQPQVETEAIPPEAATELISTDAPVMQPETTPLPFEDQTFTAETIPQKNNFGGKRIAIIAVACVLVLAIAATAVFFIVRASSPEYLVKTALSNTFNSLSVDNNKELFEHGSVTISSDLSKWDSALLGGELPMSFMMKLGMGGNEYTTLQLSATYNDETLVDLNLYETKKQISVQCDQLLSEVYGIDLTKAKDSLPNSEFAPDGAYPMDEKIYNSLLEQLNRTPSENHYAEQLMQILPRYSTLYLQAICEEGNPEKSTVDLTVGSDTFPTTAVTFTLDQNGIANVFTKLYTAFHEDEELRSLLNECLTGSYAANKIMGAQYSSVEDMMEKLYDNKAFEEKIKELRESDVVLTQVFYVAKSSKQLAAYDINFTKDGEPATVSLKLGEDLATSKCYSLSGVEEGESYELVYQISEDSDSAYESRLYAKIEDEEAFAVSYSLNRKNNRFILSIDADEETLSFSGSVEEKETTTELIFDEVSYNEVSVKVNLSILLNYNEAAPKAPEYKEILILSKTDIDSLVNDISEKAKESIAPLAELFGPGQVEPGDLIGEWVFAFEGFEDALSFTFAEDGTGAMSSYEESIPFEYSLSDGFVFITTSDGYTEEIPCSIVDGVLNLTIDGEVVSFVRK